MIQFDNDRLQRPTPAGPSRKGDDSDGPTKPSIDRPAAPSPLKDRLKKLDPDQAKKYRQRSGQ